jgi:TolB-like protein/Tfp pilus assembly protein PilF
LCSLRLAKAADLSVFSELKRRNVFRAGIAYLVTVWLLLQVADLVLDNVPAPEWVMQILLVAAAVGFPVVLLLAWVFEVTSEGVKLDSEVDRDNSITQAIGRKLDFTIIGVLSVAVAFFALDKFVWTEGASTAETGQSSIAVLPFVNMSSDQEQEYFSDGLAEELLNLLAKIPELKVTSRSTSFFYKGKDFRIADIGRELGVEHVLEGSVRRSGDRVRVTAQLIEVAEDAHIWSETWERTMDDVFAIQDEIAQAVVDGLKIRLLGDMPVTDRTVPEAYALYLQATQLLNHRNADSALRAEALLQQALEIDRDYIPTWLELARAYRQGGAVGAWHPVESFPKARNAAVEVLRLDADNVPALVMLSNIALRYDYDVESATEYVGRAMALNPDDESARQLESTIAFLSGDYDSAIRLSENAVDRDPANTNRRYGLGQTYFGARRFDEAKESFRKAIELSPTSAGSHFYLGATLLLEGDFDGALEQIERETRAGYRATGLALLYQAKGDSERADKALEDLIALGYRWTYQIAAVYAFRDEADAAFLWLDRAMDRRDTSLGMLAGDPFMDNIRDDPRLDDVLVRLGAKAR